MTVSPVTAVTGASAYGYSQQRNSNDSERTHHGRTCAGASDSMTFRSARSTCSAID
jgi:hypothetical protein